jgi:hypothetical protein
MDTQTAVTKITAAATKVGMNKAVYRRVPN